MIIDHIENAALYTGISPKIERCLQYIASTGLKQTAPFKGELEGTGITLSLSEYETQAAEERDWEAHDRCIDIQYVVCGKEYMGYANRAQMTFVKKTDGRDHLVYSGEGAKFLVEESCFAIFFPQDVHKPRLNADGVQNTKKLVCKIPL